MFRISQMYLVDAEAQYRLDPAKGLDPLNQLRTDACISPETEDKR